MEINQIGAANDLTPTSQVGFAGVGECPNCSNPLHYTKDEKTVECPYCGNSVDVKDIRTASSVRRSSSEAAASAGLMASIAMSIDSPESALVYIENFFKDYNWESYKLSSAIGIYDIDGMVEKNKIKYGATSAAWILDFESKIVPLTKKLEGLAEQEQVFLNLYDGKDSTALMAKYDLYERITSTIKDAAEKLFATLVSDIEYAERFGAEEAKVHEMKLRLNDAVRLYNENVHDFESFRDIPAVMKARELHKAKVADKLDAMGIDAEATYRKAVELYETEVDKSGALRLFQAIREYGDSIDYINKINAFFNFDSKLVKLADRHFLVKRVSAPVFSVENPEDTTEDGEEVASPTSNPTVSLYEIVDGKAYEPAAISGISYILSFYGNKLFYIKRERSLCSYDVLTHVETELDRGNIGDYPKEKLFWNKDGTAFYIRKKLSPFESEGKRGCGCLRALAAIFKGRPVPFTDDKNNFCVIKVDKANNTASVEIERLVDITECFDDRMFYIAYHAMGEKKSKRLDCFPSFMVCDLKTGEKAQVLGDDCHIHNVIGDKVIYTTWDPNEYNQMLYAYDLKTDVTTLIEANIFSYFNTIEDRVYYTVGNKKHAPLFSNNLDGTDRLEIMRNVKEVHAVIDGWMYLIRGTGRNTTLFKMSPDGKETILVCTDISSIIEMNDAYTYYTDANATLHVVRNDGKNDKVIASDIDESNVIIDKDFIYYLRRETVAKNKTAYSLYKMDLDGSNTKKLVFNVNSIQNFDENYIYIYKCAATNYTATAMENGEVKDEQTVKFKVSKFFIFDKRTETEAPLLVLGLPAEESRLEKRGCFRKDLKYTTTYTEISNKVSYKKEGLAEVGEVFAEQTAFTVEEDEAKEAEDNE